MWRILRISTGILLLLLGLAGLVLPILQGWLFLALGGMILSVDIPFFKKIACWLEAHVPGGEKLMDRLRSKFHKHGKDLPDCTQKNR
jgi:uncharacterized protein